MSGHSVVIVGGGPTGLTLAGELALAGVDVGLVERRVDQTLTGSRAGGLHARTLEIFDQRGIADRFVSQGRAAQVVGFHTTPLDISDFPTRFPYGLALWQNHIERILAQWVTESPATAYRGLTATAISQNDEGVDVQLSDGRTLRAAYVVGCDGGRSLIRKAAGIDFPGWDPTISWLIAEVETAEEPAWGPHPDGQGGIARTDEGATARIVLVEPGLSAAEPDLRDVSEALIAAYGTDFGVHTPTWISRFTDMARQAATYRERRILLAGDAAHVHAPIGGQGLNIGVQDAVNLGWKLAQVVKGTSDATLLNTYHAERHPAAARVLRNTLAQVALRRTDDRTKALGEVVSALVAMEEPRRRIAGEMSGLTLRYDFGEGHPLLGRRMPDLDLEADGGPTRVYALLREARPVLLNFGAPGVLDAATWSDRVRSLDVRCTAKWELPGLGEVAAPAAVLIRPDGHVAWVGEGSDTGLREALTAWFGPPRSRPAS